MEHDCSNGSHEESCANCSKHDQNTEVFTLQERLVECDRFFVEFGHPGSRPAENSVEVQLGVGLCFAHFVH
jgi:hypothetical protein